MSFFIDFNPEDILQQATESTHRYERGMHSCLYSKGEHGLLPHIAMS